MGDTAKSEGLLAPRSVTWLGVGVNIALSGSKIAAGVLFSSSAILADGFHSLSDLVTDVAVLAGLGVSDRPADGSHPYGHRRVSTLVAMFVGAALLGVAAWIGYGAVMSFRVPHAAPRGLVPLGLAVLSIISKEWLFHVTRAVGRRAGDVSIIANAWHHRSDAFSSVAAAIGLTVVAVGGPKWGYVDELTALVLAAFLVVPAAHIIWSSASELIDRAPARDVLESIQRAVAATAGVRDYHGVRARHVGGKVEMDIHVLVDPELTVREGHAIAAAVRASVRRADPNVVEVIVHVEPWEGAG